MDDKYSIKGVLKFTLSLVLTALSMNLMFAIDRLILGYYSVNSMNAAAIAGNLVSIVEYPIICTAQIAAVYVGQYNGDKQFLKVSSPCWQMIYLGFLSFLIFIPIGFFSEYFGLIPEQYFSEGIKYQKILLYTGGLPVFINAIASFFIGRRLGSITAFVVILGNFLNIILDYIFIFGIKNLLEPQGAAGAAIATVLSQIAQLLALLILFFNQENRKNFNTTNFRFDFKLFKDCLKTGMPVCVGRCLSMVAWYVMLLVFSYVSNDLATIESVQVTFYVMFSFFADGAGKAISALSAHLIGEGKFSKIDDLWKMFFKLNLCSAIIFAIPLIIHQDFMFFFINGINGGLSHLRSDFEFVFFTLWIIIVFDSIFSLLYGILTSGGDTIFPMCVETISIWCLADLPLIYWYHMNTLTSIRPVYVLITIGSIINAAILYYRYKKKSWIRKLV